MKKELLLSKKQQVIRSMKSNAVAQIFTDDIIRQFSIKQLNILCNVLQQVEDCTENNNPFYTLSACEVLQKSTGRIAYFHDNAEICEETEAEVLSGAACPIYKNYKQKKKQ